MTNFERYAQEANMYIKQLATDLGHPDAEGQTYILLRAVLHTVRDHITIGESLHVLSQLPLFLKGVYVEYWQYREQPLQFQSLVDFKEAVKQEQARHGERQFNWRQHTEDLIQMVLSSLGTQFLTEGQLQHIATQMPKDVQRLFPVEV